MSDKAIVRFIIEGFPVEVHFENSKGNVSPAELKAEIAKWNEAGFMPPPSFQKSAPADNPLHRFGNVTKVEGVDKNMFAFTVKVDDMEKEFVFKDFSKSAFRIGDRVQIITNARGFRVGEVVTPEEEEERKKKSEQS